MTRPRNQLVAHQRPGDGFLLSLALGRADTALAKLCVKTDLIHKYDLDIDTQNRMSEWYNVLKEAGFNGIQTPGLPYHISLAAFPLEQEQKAAELTERVAGEFAPVQVHVSHIGIFAPGKVLFGAPERNAKLELLHDACEVNPDSQQLRAENAYLKKINALVLEEERQSKRRK